MHRWLGLLLFACVAFACKPKTSAIAELTKADGPVDRQEAASAWQKASIGTKYFIGDAARTADGGAELLLAGTAKIAMQPHTVLRFGGKGGKAKIAVEIGAIDLSGAGQYGLDVGDVKLGANGSVRITAKGGGQSEVQLVVGQGSILTLDGKSLDLQIGQTMDLGIGPIQMVDAGVDAAPDAAAPPDAAEPVSGDVTVDVTGKNAEVQAPGDTKWTKLPAGGGTLPKGTKLRLGAATSAKLVSGTTTFELGASSRMTIADDMMMGLELGGGRALVPTSAEGKIGVPGGDVTVKGTPTGPGEAHIDVNARGEAKVSVVRGAAKLSGTGGAALEMNRGETASLAKAGAIHPLEAIPNYYDFSITVGETPNFTIHDPRGQTALQFNFGGKCPNGGVIEMDHDPHFRTAKLSAGKDSANMMISGGGWAYRLRCTVGDAEGNAVASGHVGVIRDDGRRPLPKEPPTNPIDVDGRTYRISYQSAIPSLKIKFPAGAASYKLHLATGGTELEAFDSTTPSVTVPSNKLKEGTYTYWVDRDGVRYDKMSTLIINFDQTAPQVYIESPGNGQPFGVEVDVRGAVLPGWRAFVDSVEIPVDKNTRRFAAKVPPPSGGLALAIKLSHPQRGTHFYLRRGGK